MSDFIKRFDMFGDGRHECDTTGDWVRYDDHAAEIQRLLLANETLTALNAEYAERIKALEAKGEPVLYVSPDDLANELFVGMNAVRKVHQDFGKHYTVALYTTPPSVDALIADIDGMRIVSMTKGDWVDSDELKAILDKHRSAK